MAPNKAKARAKWLIKLLALEQPLQIADIGARITKEVPVYRSLLDHSVAHLHGFELEAVAFEELEAAAGENVSAYPYAVGKPGPATFYAHHMLDGDAVYIRNVEDRDAPSTHQLKALALAADIIVQSYDLCVYCLEVLKARGAVPRSATRQYYGRLPVDVLADQPAKDPVKEEVQNVDA